MKKTIKDRIDIEVKGYGRFCKRSGATTRPEHAARKALVYRLIEAGQLDVIGLLDRDQITWAELRQAERKDRLRSDALAADVRLSRRLWDDGETKGALSTTLASMGKSPLTRDRYQVAFDHLEEFAADFLPATALVKDVRDVEWPTVFAAMHELSAASRNRVRSGVSAFLTKFLGDKFHPFRRAVVVAMGTMEAEATPPKEITLAEFWTNVEALDDEIFRAIAIVLAGTGLRIGEYLQTDETSRRRLPLIWLPGGKSGAGESAIAPALLPYAELVIPCRIAPVPKKHRGVQYDARYKRIQKAFQRAAVATGIPWSPHYLRHLYAQVGTAALPESLVQQGLRHKTASMTRHYSRRRTTQQVANVVGTALVKAKKTAAKSAKGKAPSATVVRGKVWDHSRKKAI